MGALEQDTLEPGDIWYQDWVNMTPAEQQARLDAALADITESK